MTLRSGLLAGALALVPGMAQDGGAQEALLALNPGSLQWTSKGLLVPIVGSSSAAILTQDRQRRSELPRLEGDPTYFHLQGAFWATARMSGLETREGPRELTRLWKLEGGAWRQCQAFVARPGEGMSHLFPLEAPGRYLGLSLQRARSKADGEIFFILASDEKGELKEVGRSGAGLRKHPLGFRALDDVFSSPILVGDQLILFAPRAGLFWIVDLRLGTLKRLVRLVATLDDRDLDRSDLLPAVIGVQPTPQGRLLIAARTSQVVLEGAKEAAAELKALSQAFEASLLPRAPDEKGVLEAMPLDDQNPWYRVQNTLVRIFPEVEWHELDPDTGSIQHLTPPPAGAPVRLQSYAELLPFRFLPLGEGRVDCSRGAWDPLPAPKVPPAARAQGASKAGLAPKKD